MYAKYLAIPFYLINRNIFISSNYVYIYLICKLRLQFLLLNMFKEYQYVGIFLHVHNNLECKYKRK